MKKSDLTDYSDMDGSHKRERNRPRQPRRKGKNGGTAAIWIVVIVVLVLAGGGVSLYFALSGKATENGPAKLSERFLGEWEGTSSEHPSLALRLEVAPGRLYFTAQNKITGDGGRHSHLWKIVRESPDKLIISQHLEKDAKGTYEWSITFSSGDKMSVRSLTDNRTLGDYRRVDKGSAPKRPAP